MRSRFIREISLTRFCSMLMRDSTSLCRSFAAWYSAFSRRSPSSRARLISLGSSVFSSLSSAWISSSNFLSRRAFIRRMVAEDGRIADRQLRSRATIDAGFMERISSRQNPLVKRFREIGRGDSREWMLLDGEHLIDEALASGVRLDVAAFGDGLVDGRLAALAARTARA